jgi:hypothetical protein
MADILALKGYKRNGPFALDAKSKWDTYAEALNFVKTDAAAYPGMVIAVSGQKEAAVYEAIYDTDGTTLTLQELALKSSSISDTLKSEMYTYLNSYITSGDSSTLSESKEYTDSKIATVYKYKGSVQSYDLLPLTDNQVGDTYNVYAANGSVPAGANYAWNGAAWDSLPGTVDLSSYASKKSVSDEEARAKASEAANASAISSEISTRSSAIAAEQKIRGDADNKIQTLIDSEASTRSAVCASLQTAIDNKGATVLAKTWSELKSLRDSGGLMPGQKYRITDYAFSTCKSDVQSAGHQFDLVVTAISANSISEKASAAIHDGDDYFANANLSAWDISYCIDNDWMKYIWALQEGKFVKCSAFGWIKETGTITITDTTAGTTSSAYLLTNDSIAKQYTKILSSYMPAGSSIYGIGTTIAPNILKIGDSLFVVIKIGDIYVADTQDMSLKVVGTEIINSYSGKGVIYHMRDEFGNECDYDFKNVKYKGFSINNGSESVGLDSGKYYYTFDCEAGSYDLSLTGSECNNNVVKGSPSRGSTSEDVWINDLSYDIFESTKGIILPLFSKNEIGYGSMYNIMLPQFYNTTFGNDCKYNYFYGDCSGLRMSDECSYVFVGPNSVNEYFGNGCSNITLSGSGNIENSFADECHGISGSVMRYSSFGKACMYISIGEDSSSNSFDDGCSYIDLVNSGTSGSISNYHVHHGVSGTASSHLSISASRGLDYATDVVSSKTVEVKV